MKETFSRVANNMKIETRLDQIGFDLKKIPNTLKEMIFAHFELKGAAVLTLMIHLEQRLNEQQSTMQNSFGDMFKNLKVSIKSVYSSKSFFVFE